MSMIVIIQNTTLYVMINELLMHYIQICTMRLWLVFQSVLLLLALEIKLLCRHCRIVVAPSVQMSSLLSDSSPALVSLRACGATSRSPHGNMAATL